MGPFITKHCPFLSNGINFFFFHFLGLHLQHVEVPRRGVESELQLPAYTTATATRDPSPTEQGQGLNPCPHGYWSGSIPLSRDGNSSLAVGTPVPTRVGSGFAVCPELCLTVRLRAFSSPPQEAPEPSPQPHGFACCSGRFM